MAKQSPKENPAKEAPKATEGEATPVANDELTAKVNMLEELIVEKDEQINNLELAVSKLSVKSQSNQPIKLPVVQVGDESYQLKLQRVKFGGQTITAEDVANDEELAAKLVTIGSGMLELI